MIGCNPFTGWQIEVHIPELTPTMTAYPATLADRLTAEWPGAKIVVVADAPANLIRVQWPGVLAGGAIADAPVIARDLQHTAMNLYQEMLKAANAT